jgi:membrane protease YdiL (CAAX protease family)
MEPRPRPTPRERVVRQVDRLTGLPAFETWGFVLFSHGWTWAFWSVPILAGWPAFEQPGIAFLLLGGAGVPVGGVAMTYHVEGRQGLQDLRDRLLDTDRITWRWALLVGGLWLGLAIVAAGLAALLGDGQPLALAAELTTAGPGELLLSLVAILLIGPLPEEVGWRGYWLDRLQRRYSALTSSLVLGVAWAAWHAPLFVMVGYFSRWDFDPQPTQFAVAILLGAVLYTWVYNNTERSLLAMVGLHFAGNATGQFLDLSATAQQVELIVTAALVVVVVGHWGPTDLRLDGGRPTGE